jgi:hypothetical protein
MQLYGRLTCRRGTFVEPPTIFCLLELKVVAGVI